MFVNKNTPVFTVESRTLLTHDNYYPEYVPDRQPWDIARSICLQRSGSFVMVSSTEEIQKLNSFLRSLNITQPVWIESADMLQKTGEHHIPHFPACLIFATLSISFFSKHYRLFSRSSRHIHAGISNASTPEIGSPPSQVP